MALSRGKARDRTDRKRIAERTSRPGTRSRVKSTRRKRENTPYQRQPYDSISIPRLVYELLTIDKYNQDAERSPDRLGTRSRRRTRRYHERQRLPYGKSDYRSDDSEPAQVPDYSMESRPTSIESLTEVMDAANNSVPTSSANSSVSNISIEPPITLANSLNSARTLFRKRSLVQLVNSYIKEGIEEGKRQAKMYIRKALSFGMRSGYLFPADSRGSVLRVCPTLSSRRADAESRQRRHTARRETVLTTIDDRKAMRRGVPRNKSTRHRVPAETTTSKKRYKRHPTESPARSLSKSSRTRKSPDASVQRDKNKPKSDAKRKRISDKVNNKRGQRRKRNNSEEVKKPVKRRRTALSAKRPDNNCDKSIENSYKDVNGRDARDQYASNENNYRTVVEKRKSTSSLEDESRAEKQKAEINIDDDRDDQGGNDDDVRDQGGNDDDDDEKSEEASIEHDANDTTKETADT